MDVRSLAFRTDLFLLGLGGSETEDRGDHLVVHTPHNPSFFWGNFILLDHPPEESEIDRWVAAYDAEFPDTRHRAFGVDGTEDNKEAMRRFERAGLSLEMGSVMTATSVHEPPRPNTEAEFRILESDDDWAQRVQVAVSCNEDHPPDSYLEFATRKAETERGMTQAGHGVWWGAFLDGQMVSGLGLFRTWDRLARFQSVETHPDFRGRGLAGTMVHRASRHGFESLGAETLVMVADPDYLAIRIYRSV